MSVAMLTIAAIAAIAALAACSSGTVHPAGWTAGYTAAHAIDQVGWTDIASYQGSTDVGTARGGEGAIEYSLNQEKADDPLSFPLNNADASQVCSGAMLVVGGNNGNGNWNQNWVDGCTAAFEAGAQPSGM